MQVVANVVGMVMFVAVRMAWTLMARMVEMVVYKTTGMLVMRSLETLEVATMMGMVVARLHRVRLVLKPMV
jgi:hypothetical protein